ncbi:MAG: biotin/lipoyl-containing protein, partial [Roseiarcus sp.]
MANTIDVKVPDIGDYKDVPIIEVLVKPGEVVKADQSLVTLESDKATMDVPAPGAGTVREIVAKVGDKVAMGSLILRLEPAAGAGAAPAAPAPPAPAAVPAPPAAPAAAP